MSAYRPYPKTKPSGVEWLGEVPEGWKVSKPKFSAPFQVGWTPPTAIDANFEGENLWANISDLKRKVISDTAKRISDEAAATASMSITPRGSLLYSFKLSVGAVSFAAVDLYTNEAIASFLPNPYSHLPFLYYALQVSIIENATENIYGAKILNQELIRSAPFPLPPLPEQQQIAAFLDRECGKLDALQAKQERLIELLKEKRQALISHAVTKGLPGVASAKTGLDPTAKLKPSGIEWLGEVPEHWIPTKVKWVSLTVKTGGTPCDPSWFTEEPEVPWLTPGDFSDDSFRMSARRFVSRDAIAKREAPSFPPSSIFVVGIGATLGKVARLAQRQPASSNQQINAIVPSKKIESDYLFYSLLAQTEQMKNCSSASTLDIMNQEKTKSLHITLPPLAEQRAIVAHLDEKCGKIDQLKAKAERGIELLKERRSALISAAVTGKIDVREV
jgi:type I restriction enzyme, S subunit